MVRVFYPPEPAADPSDEAPFAPSVFLAGTIDMGVSHDWQADFIATLGARSVTADIFNPRRAAWNASWKQDIKNDEFRRQVEWELDHIDMASHLVFHFEPSSKSPITLMELGLVCGNRAWVRNQNIYVSCPPGYWRRGNVQIVCARHEVPLFDSLGALTDSLIVDLES